MKSRIFAWITAITLFTVLAMSVQLTAQKEQQEQAGHFQHYTVTDLRPLPGGTFSQATFVGNTGVVTGVATTADGAQHAVLWGVGGQIMDIATAGLGGRNSAALGITPRGQAAGGLNLPLSIQTTKTFAPTVPASNVCRSFGKAAL